MAKQAGIMPLEGTLGEYTFFKTQDGYMVRTRGGVSAERIATDPDFQRTRENNAEFSRACQGGKVLRVSLRNIILKAKDSRMVSRLSALMLKVVQADVTSDRGERNIIDGEAGLLEGFEFNLGAKLAATLFAPYTVSFDRAGGTGEIDLAGFVPLNMVVAPQGTTHFQLFAATSSIDFEAGVNDTMIVQSGELPYNSTDTGAINLKMRIGSGSKHPVMVVLGIEFMQAVNGKMYPLKNGSFNACAIVKVDSPV